jgi:heat-inducible transcriptional repressor
MVRVLVITVLDERKKIILKSVIEDYVNNAEPIGSKYFVSKHSLNVSPATIRNELSALEEMGYLTHPYTSAGRVPTERGYRFYVDSLINIPQLPKGERLIIDDFYSLINAELQQLIEKTSTLLAEISSYVALVFAPALRYQTLKHVDFIQIGDNSVLVILITKEGTVTKEILELNENFDSDKLSEWENLLNKELSGLSSRQVREVSPRLKQRITDDRLQHLIRKIEEMLFNQDELEVYTQGTENLLDQPEFDSLSKVKDLLEALRQSSKFLDLAWDFAEHCNIIVKIGSENDNPKIEDCSLVAAGYRVDGELHGALGVLGPTRMDYKKAISAVTYVAETLGETIKSVCGRR